MSSAPRGNSAATATTAKAPAPSGRDHSRPDDRPPAERITVALIPKAAEDLKLLQDRTGLSRTDIANRAITLYEFVDDRLQAGQEVLIRNKRTGETLVVMIL